MTRFSVLKRFSGASLFTHFFIFLRLASCPFDEIIRYIPKKGSLLDIGTGFGLLPLSLATRSAKRSIMGVDPDGARIRVARKAARGSQNVSFATGSLTKQKQMKKYDAASLIDVLYLLPWEEKAKLLRTAHSSLAPKGTLIVKINDRAFTLAYFFTWLQEMMTVRIFKKTASDFRDFYFENATEMQELLEANGFRVYKIVKLTTPFPFFHPHWLLLARRS